MLQKELDAAMVSARRDIDATGYGRWVGDDKLKPVIYNALAAAEQARKAWELAHHADPSK